MTAELIVSALAWCSLINIAILAGWLLMFVMAHDGMHRITCRWFKLSTEKFDAIQYAAMGFYELSIFLFNLVPYLVLRALIG